MSESTLTLVLLYPEILGTYGDRGNAIALAHRAGARGIRTELLEVGYGDALPESGDIYLVGGSEDTAQALAARALAEQPGAVRILTDNTVLAVCAGFQLMGRSYRGGDGAQKPGLGILDVECHPLSGERAVGELLIETAAATPELAGLESLTGFENHASDARLGPGAKPLGRVVGGIGNGDGTEGAVQGRMVATYLHGPVLVRNPGLADVLLERTTGPLAPYEDEAVTQLRRERIDAVLNPPKRRLSLRPRR